MLCTSQEEESLAAQVDGGKLELFGKLNATRKCVTQTDAVTRAEEHAEELRAAASQLQQYVSNMWDWKTQIKCQDTREFLTQCI